MLIRIGGDKNIAWNTNCLISCPINSSPLFWLGKKSLPVFLLVHSLINAERMFAPYITIR